MKGYYFVIVSVIFFIFSLFNCSFYLEKGSYVSGYVALLFGWIEMLRHFGGDYCSWLANPFLVVSWGVFLFSGKNNVLLFLSLFFSLLSFILSFSFLFTRPTEIIINLAGGKSLITGVGNGYYLWLSSIVIVLLGNIGMILKNNFINNSKVSN